MEKILFYGPSGEYGFLCNFYFSPFELNGYNWKTNEHFFQAQKFQFHKSHFDKILNAETPGEAKQLGRMRSVPLRPDWDLIKYQVMLRGLEAKFKQNLELKEKLLATGNCELVEDSPTDFIWGIGANGTGQNLLGKALMEVRKIFLLSLDFFCI